MLKVLRLSAIPKIILTAAAVFFLPLSSFAAISGSKHDFSQQSWNSSKEICIVCHTPHNVVSQPVVLWNHESTTATFTLYSSPTLKGSPEQPRNPSKICLSCHDGTVAVDSFGQKRGSYPIGQGQNANLTTDLSNDHPISIKYQHGDVGPGTVCTVCHIGHDVKTGPFFVSGYVECSSCHDVHNNTIYTKLLRKSVQKSELCFHCHNK